MMIPGIVKYQKDLIIVFQDELKKFQERPSIEPRGLLEYEPWIDVNRDCPEKLALPFARMSLYSKSFSNRCPALPRCSLLLEESLVLEEDYRSLFRCVFFIVGYVSLSHSSWAS